MNYKLFNELAENVLKYVPPQNDWKFIHADSYQMYNITNQQIYNSSFPEWTEVLKQTLFTDIGNHIGQKDALISNLTLVRCKEHTVLHPLPVQAGVITLQSNGMFAAIRNMTPEKARLNAYRSMYLHSPHLFKWHEVDAFGFVVDEQKNPMYPGNRIMNLYPKDGTLFWYYKVDSGFSKHGVKKDGN